MSEGVWLYSEKNLGDGERSSALKQFITTIVSETHWSSTPMKRIVVRLPGNTTTYFVPGIAGVTGSWGSNVMRFRLMDNRDDDPWAHGVRAKLLELYINNKEFEIRTNFSIDNKLEWNEFEYHDRVFLKLMTSVEVSELFSLDQSTINDIWNRTEDLNL